MEAGSAPNTQRQTDEPAASESFTLLHPRVQRWIWQQGWSELRDIQERAIPVLISAQQDVLISAPTAQGKTEAAFLPILSRLAEPGARPSGFGSLYVSPLRALINDQFRRLDDLCEALQLPVFRWHGDVSDAVKRRARTEPAGGVALITPESLEALLIRRGTEVPWLVRGLSHIVIDEMHSFMGTERGRHLQSILHRIDLAAQRKIPRVGLSATLADLAAAAEFLRPAGGGGVMRLDSRTTQQELRLQLRGYLRGLDGKDSQPDTNTKISAPESGADRDPRAERDDACTRNIAQHIFQHVRGTRSLIFAGSRRSVESLTRALSDLCEQGGVPNEFVPHHGSLSAELREEAEARMRDERLPTSVVCTTTLELGIDVGDIDGVAQVGAPPSVAAMRQRLGRSGRRAGRPAVMRMYVAEDALNAHSPLLTRLRCETVQSIAAVELMLKKWNEPADPQGLHLSTLVHQILALIAQHGGIQPGAAFEQLCRTGPFRSIDASLFKALLRQLASSEVRLIEQSKDGTLLLGAEGEELVDSYQFYAVFQTPKEYRVLWGARVLGMLPRDENQVWQGQMILLGGRRWFIKEVDERSLTLIVEPASGGNAPRFAFGQGPALSDGLVETMKETYQQLAVPAYLNKAAIDLLQQGRTGFAQAGLHDAAVVRDGKEWLLFPWVGTAGLLTLSLGLRLHRVVAVPQGMAISITATDSQPIRAALEQLAVAPPDGETLAAQLLDPAREKFDRYLGPALLRRSAGSSYLQPQRLPEIAIGILNKWPAQ